MFIVSLHYIIIQIVVQLLPLQLDINSMIMNDQSSSLATGKSADRVNRTLACDVRGKLFKAKQNLAAHSITHTGHKNFECEIYVKCFGKRVTWQSTALLTLERKTSNVNFVENALATTIS